ncbi:hypothetical protein [Tatumella ptyseos]|uniref:hypothetical protein n=1 Tax=Tatumella ptyseos TaxID=82987 RepID=UPI0023F47BB0|nr:hypothetical protein [Tatumella ptyseos]
MKKILICLLAGSMLAAGSLAAGAATMDITASFTPSVSNPENNTFTNTTPTGGYCSTWPQYCSGVSVELPGIMGVSSRAIPARQNADKRDGLFFKIPVTPHNVVVTNRENGESHTVSFRASAFGVQFTPAGDNNGWGAEGQGTLGYPEYSGSNGCSSGAGGQFGTSGTATRFIWNFTTAATAGCYRISILERAAGIKFTNYNMGYILTAPDPLKMGAGIYEGSITYSVGPGGDFDFGDNIQVSDTTLTINFTLTVNHELKLSTTADNQQVALQPCASGKVCTAEEGAANWERWMITRATPELTGRSNFSLSSSGTFTVYLQCEQQSGSDCALKSDNTPSQTVPVQSLLTLPRGIVDSSTGSGVSKRRLAAGRDLTKNVFVTKSFGENQAGSIDFLVSRKDVDTMLETRPDTYRGAITVIFDPKIY